MLIPGKPHPTRLSCRRVASRGLSVGRRSRIGWQIGYIWNNLLISDGLKALMGAKLEYSNQIFEDQSDRGKRQPNTGTSVQSSAKERMVVEIENLYRFWKVCVLECLGLAAVKTQMMRDIAYKVVPSTPEKILDCFPMRNTRETHQNLSQ